MHSDQISISFGCGLRMCERPRPGADGLKGANEPYGFGMPMSSGMYALGLGSACKKHAPVTRCVCRKPRQSRGTCADWGATIRFDGAP
jgi:hypothetical protein